MENVFSHFMADSSMLSLILKFYFSAVGVISLLYLILIAPKILYYTFARRKLQAFIIIAVITLLFWFSFTRNLLAIFITIIYALNALTLLIYCINRFTRKEDPKPDKESSEGYRPSVSVIFAVKNEGSVIAESIKKVLEMDYPEEKLKVIVIDDHSTDNTLKIISDIADGKKVRVFQNPGEPGKASAINSSLSFIDTDLVLMLDADHHVPEDYLKKAVYMFKNPRLGLVQGMLTIRNGKKSLIARLVELEYYAFYQVFYAARVLTVYLGTGAIFRKKALLEAGNFNNNICTEDMEMSFRIHQLGYEVKFSTDITTYELAPDTLQHFIKQRYRWIRGTWQAFYAQLGNMFSNRKVSISKKMDYLQIGITPFVLVCYFMLNIFYLLDVTGISTLPFSYYIIYFLNLAILIFFTVGLYWSRQLKLSLYIVLVPFFYMIYSFACIKGIVDEFLFNSKFKGVKADRMNLNAIEPIDQAGID
jgi:cellulose synthase/poly-beta-1,6-N-acetylglucosamine synthase-like glycosyltransferase